MPTLELTNEQVIELVKQLPPGRKHAVLVALAADRGRDWDSMTKEERETFINAMIQEDR